MKGKKNLPNIWKEFAEHLRGSHSRLLGLIDTHTDMIKKLEKRIKALEKSSQKDKR